MPTRIAVSLILLILASAVSALAQDTRPSPTGRESPPVPVLFIPGYAGSSPRPSKILSFALRRGAPPQDLELSPSYRPFVRSLENAGYREGTTFFGAVYD